MKYDISIKLERIILLRPGFGQVRRTPVIFTIEHILSTINNKGKKKIGKHNIM